MKSISKQLSEPSRRNFLKAVASSTLGVSILPNNAFSAERRIYDASDAKCKNVIFLYMKGAMAHMDTLDPKSDSEIQGLSSPVNTSVDGIQFSNFLPKLGKQADKMAIIRSMTSKTGAHVEGSYLMHTAYALSPGISHPRMGPWAQYFLGKRPGPMPDSVVIGGGNPGPGFFTPDHSPFPVGSPGDGIKDLLPKVDQAEFRKRVDLASQFSAAFSNHFQHPKVETYSEFYEQTVQFLDGESVEAFDINKEPSAVKDLYGGSSFGKGCLLACRLVENGVRYVEVKMPQGWDMHFGMEQLEDNTAILDTAMSALLIDLEQRGLLESTMVVLATEFGRTPKINGAGGRGHHPRVFSTALAGGGINGGMVYGKSDEKGFACTENPVTVADFHATIAQALGLPPDRGRPELIAKYVHWPGGIPIGGNRTPFDPHNNPTPYSLHLPFPIPPAGLPLGLSAPSDRRRLGRRSREAERSLDLRR